jgi:hypothetical protein
MTELDRKAWLAGEISSADEAWTKIVEACLLRARGKGPNRKEESLALARVWKLPLEEVDTAWKEADASFFSSATQPSVEQAPPDEPKEAKPKGREETLEDLFGGRLDRALKQRSKEAVEPVEVETPKVTAPDLAPDEEPASEEEAFREEEPLAGPWEDEIARLERELAEKKALIPTNNRPLLVTPGMAAQKPVVALNELNKKHSVILNLGGKCVVMEWTKSQVDPRWEEPSYQTFASFKERYMNRYVETFEMVKGGAQKIGAAPVAGWWLSQPGRRQYEGLDLVPNAPMALPGQRLNLWRGWGVEPKEGDWSLLRNHIRVVIANEEQRSEEYILRYIAWKYQNAGKPPEVALAFKGKKGIGKGALMYAMLTAFGPHRLEIHNPEHLTGKHNKHLQNRLLLCADEAIWAGDKQAERVLKGMVTEKTLTIEPKGIDAFPWPNRLAIIQSTNEKWVVPATWDERRYAVFEVNPIHMQKRDYFEPLFREIDGGGAAAMLYDLLRLDLNDWHPRYDIPQTKALVDQKVQSLDGFEQWWLSKLSTGETPQPEAKNPRWVLSKRLYTEAIEHNARNRYLTDSQFGQFLGKMGCEHKSNGKAWGWVFPPLDEARRAWEIKMGGTYEWLRPDVKEWNEK